MDFRSFDDGIFQHTKSAAHCGGSISTRNPFSVTTYSTNQHSQLKRRICLWVISVRRKRPVDMRELISVRWLTATRKFPSRSWIWTRNSSNIELRNSNQHRTSKCWTKRLIKIATLSCRFGNKNMAIQFYYFCGTHTIYVVLIVLIIINV